MKNRYLIFSLCFLLLCVSNGAAQVGSSQQPPVKTVDDGAPTLKTPEDKRYQLVSGDVLDVIYRYTPEFNQTVTIQPDGYVFWKSSAI
jgi:protein involved in polysaccharide export with SLBB domain